MTQYVTADEAMIIAMAVREGVEFVDVHVVTPNGECDTRACGRCGRIVCHPDCSRLRLDGWEG